MPLYKKSDLLDERIRKSLFDSKQILIKEAAEFDVDEGYDIFLSHSYKDAILILNLKRDIEALGFSIYVDWVDDPQLDRSDVTPGTAEIIRKRIDSSKCLIYVPSENSSGSKWMPWELGYADGAKTGKAAILPISESRQSTETYNGREYLGLYCYVTKNKIQGTDENTLWVKKDASTYVKFENWLNGELPYKRQVTSKRFLL